MVILVFNALPFFRKMLKNTISQIALFNSKKKAGQKRGKIF